MATTDIPNPASRDYDQDLRALAKRVVTDRLDSDGTLTDHVIETPDLLVRWVQDSIGVNFSINWNDLTDEELADVGAWQGYCTGLFDDVKDYVLNAIG